MRTSFVFPALVVTALATTYGCMLPLQGLSRDDSGGAGGTSVTSAGGAPTTATGTTTAAGMTSTTSTGTVECSSGAECGTNSPCVTYTCEMSKCRQTNTTDQTKVGTDTPGDCKQTVCLAGVVTIVADFADLIDDGNPCTVNACDDTGPTTTSVVDGDPCGSGQFCLGGSCHECASDANCAADQNPCTTAACTGGSCEQKHNTDVCNNGGAGLCVGGNCCSTSSACLVALTCCDAGTHCTLFGCKPN